MQFSFLMYHYFSAKETYNAIRVMITCYVWMTGFGTVHLLRTSSLLFLSLKKKGCSHKKKRVCQTTMRTKLHSCLL